MDFLIFTIPEHIIRAVCTSLIYSLWQGLLLAAFTGLIILFTRKSNPIVRYNFLITGLLIFCSAIIFTLCYQLNKESKGGTGGAAVSTMNFSSNSSISPLADAETSNNPFFGFLTNHAHTIVLIWFLIVLARTIQLVTGLYSLSELRRKAIFNVGSDLQNNGLILAAKMGIKQGVKVAESALIKVPMVIGHLKPLILIPVGLLIALPPSAIEAILVHELAHISRRDYLINLLISVIEVIFFFNPAVLWLASLIRAEREHCCDDIVVAQTSNKTEYIKALIACQEYHLGLPAYAMALNGNKNHLLGRVRRILSKNNQSLNLIEKSLLTLCLVVAGMLTIAFSNAEKINKFVNPPEIIKAKNEIVVNPEKKERPEITIADIPLTMLSIANGNNEIPDTSKYQIYLPYQSVDQSALPITNGNFQTVLLKQNGITYPINAKEEYTRSLQVNGNTVPVTQYHKYVTIIDSLQREKTVSPKVSSRKNRLDYINYQTDSARKYERSKNQYRSSTTEYGGRLATPSTVAPIADVAPIANVAPEGIKMVHGTDNSKKLVEAMLNDSLVSDVKSFRLSESELIINGKRIPNLAYSAFKDKNIQSFQKGTTVYYHFDTNTVIN